MRGKLMILKNINDSVVNQFEQTIALSGIKHEALLEMRDLMREAQRQLREYLISTEAD